MDIRRLRGLVSLLNKMNQNYADSIVRNSDELSFTRVGYYFFEFEYSTNIYPTLYIYLNLRESKRLDFRLGSPIIYAYKTGHSPSCVTVVDCDYYINDLDSDLSDFVTYARAASKVGGSHNLRHKTKKIEVDTVDFSSFEHMKRAKK
ncbi:MAG: hypothetical protein V3V84_07755 [Candidatus Bathyarchaeia archaeon]